MRTKHLWVGALVLLAIAAAPSSRRKSAPVRFSPELGREYYMEAISLLGQLRSRSAAPYGDVAPGALAAAHSQKGALKHEGAIWQPLGTTPMRSDDATFAISRLGHGTLSGRVTAFADDPSSTGHHFLASAAGGVFATTDGGESWRSIGDNLPTQVVGAIGYSAASQVLVVGTGDNAFGGSSQAGLGIYHSKNHGRGWKKAKGVPDEILTFRIAFDPGDPSGQTVYAATSKGLFRSTDAGGSFVNVRLPTGACAGDGSSRSCFFANIVSDVVVRAEGHAVLAAVGWRAGRALNKGDGAVQSPHNGIYRSESGAPDTFTFVDAGEMAPSLNGFATNPVVGRVALGAAQGPGQDPDIVYAIVQDAKKFAGCLDVLDVSPVCDATAQAAVHSTILDGAYVSRDFGLTWTKIMDWAQLREPGTNSSLGGVSAQVGYGPGVQSWFNMWIAADPTATDLLTGAPTRVLFGLEEVWENTTYRAPVIAPTQWRVIGRYWNACFGGVTLTAGFQCNGAEPPMPGTTTHPDQHAAMLVPDGLGGVTLFVGNDGGVYKQSAGPLDDFDNESWGKGANVGLNTLQMYDAAIAKDGALTAGLQDNGQVLIEPGTRRAVAIFGGDGFDSGIDPDDSARIVEEYAEGAVSITVDGGRNWTGIDPALTAPLFWTPLVTDPTDANHFVVGGREVKERRDGYNVDDSSWATLFDLGTAPSGANRQASALDVRGDTIYVGFCGYCDVVTQNVPFSRGIATTVNGAWAFAAATGLPVRYITSIRMDPANRRTVYVTLGGYGRRWVPPGMVGEDTSLVGEGHVFKSTDGGQRFVDISGNLPDVPANWSLVRQGRLLVATDIGVFISTDTAGGSYSVLGEGLPAAPVFKLRLQPGDANHLIAATYGRGAYSLRFAPPPSVVTTPAQGSISATVVPLVAAADLGNDTRDVTAATFEFDALSGFDNNRMLIDATYSLPADVDLYLQRRQSDGTYVDVASSITSRLDGESLQFSMPPPGHYRLYVEEYLGPPLLTVSLKIRFFNAQGVPTL